jgi:hypothetical protein
MFLFFLPKPTVFHPTDIQGLDKFEEKIEDIKREIIPKLDKEGAQNVLPIMGRIYDVGAHPYDPRNGDNNVGGAPDNSHNDEGNAKESKREYQESDFPTVMELTKGLKNVVLVGAIKVGKQFQQSKYCGYAAHSNTTLRYFYIIDSPGINRTGIWIDGEKRFFNENQWICGDVSKETSLFNKDKYNYAYLLFIDILRPETIKKGESSNMDIEKDEIAKCFI